MEQLGTHHPVITIGRQYGSGGREIGRRVAQHLGIAFYDKELLELAAQKAGLHPDVVRSAEEQPTNSLLYSAVIGAPSPHSGLASPYHMPLTDQVFLAQADIIRELAAKESCIIIGRCADYVLRDHPHCLNIFIYANIEVKVARCMRYYGLREQEARERIRKIDKQRAGYYNFFANKHWGATASYNLALDVGLFGVDGCADIIEEAVKQAAQQH